MIIGKLKTDNHDTLLYTINGIKDRIDHCGKLRKMQSADIMYCQKIGALRSYVLTEERNHKSRDGGSDSHLSVQKFMIVRL